MTSALRKMNVFWVLTCCGVLAEFYLVTFLYYGSLIRDPINVDAGYFLPVAQRLAQGMVPIKDLTVAYTPLGMYFLAAVSYVMKDGEALFWPYLALIQAFVFLSSGAVYKIARCSGSSRSLSLLAAFSTLLLVFMFEGRFIELEPFCLIFILLAVLIYLHGDAAPRQLFWVGVMVGLSFLCKQYGALAGLAFAAMAIGVERGGAGIRLARGAWLAAGFCVSILPGFLWLTVGYDLPAADIVSGFWVSGYLDSSTRSLSALPPFVLRYLPLLWAVPFYLVFLVYRTSRSGVGQRHPVIDVDPLRSLTLQALLFLSMSLSLMVRHHPHYFILVIPFGVLACVIMISSFERMLSGLPLARQIVASLALLGFLVPMIRMSLAIPSPELWRGSRDAQFALAKKVNAFWPRSTRVSLFADPALFFTGGLYPADDRYPAYVFPSNFSAAENRSFIEKSNYVLVDGFEWTPILLKGLGEFSSLSDYLRSRGFELRTRIDRQCELWERKSPGADPNSSTDSSNSAAPMSS